MANGVVKCLISINFCSVFPITPKYTMMDENIPNSSVDGYVGSLGTSFATICELANAVKSDLIP